MVVRSLNQAGLKRRKDQRYWLDDAGRNLMQAVYGNPDYGTISESIDYLMVKLHASREAVKRWASEMGLTHTRDDLWSDEELAYLHEHFEQASVKAMAEHLGRSENAVRIKARRLKYHRVGGDNYSVQSLASILGCDWKTVAGWIHRGWLKAHLDTSIEKKQYSITPTEVRRFLIAYPRVYDHKRIDYTWLLDILVGNEEIGKIKAKKVKM